MLGENSDKIPNTNSGFTLIEMLVVVVVLGIGLIGALSFFNINISNQFEAKNELIAASLAQEGADLVRNKIDYEKLKGTSWSGILAVLKGPACASIDYRSLDSHQCYTEEGVTSKKICFSSGRYQQCPGGTDTGMTRALTISLNGDGGLAVRCDVTWNGRTTTANDIIYGNNY